MSKELNLNETMAYPFMEMGIKVDEVIHEGYKNDQAHATMESNVALWMFFKHLMANSTKDTSFEINRHIEAVCCFMTRVAQYTAQEVNAELLGRVVTLNLNMSEIILKTSAVPDVPKFAIRH